MGWLIPLAAGLFLIAFSVVYQVMALVNQQQWRNIPVRDWRAVNLSSGLRQWMERAEKELGGSGHRWSRHPFYLLLAAALSIAGFVFATFWLNNLAAGVILAIGGFAFPEQIRHSLEQRKKETVLGQMGSMVKLFSSEYKHTPQPVKAIGKVADHTPDPVGGILSNAYRGLISGRDKDLVLIQLGNDLDNIYGRMFVQLFRLSYEVEAIKPAFTVLGLRMGKQKELIQQNQRTINADRFMNLAMNLAIIPIYIVMVRMIPQAFQFYTTTAAGKLVIALAFASGVSMMIIDRLVTREGDL